MKKTYLTLLLILLSLGLGACRAVARQEIAAVTPLPPPGAAAPGATAAPSATPPPAVSPAVSLAATPTPLDLQLPAGSALAIAMATDVAMRPTIDVPLTFDEGPVPITFSEFYAGFDMRKGLTLSDKLKSLDGVEVVMEGYMAPPLKPALDWFVLTRIRLAFCPFCSSDADWPSDIALIYVRDGTIVATQAPVRIRGRMEVGSAVDPESGMVSLVRIYADEIEVIRS